MTDSARFEARVTQAVRKYRRDLIERDKAAQKLFALQLREAHQALLKELEAARAAVESSRTRGANENTFRLQRALDMAQQAEMLLRQYAQNGTSYIAQQQREVSTVAYQAAQEFLDTTNPPPPNFPNASSFMTFPKEALETITAATTNGPVAELLNRYGADAAKKAGRILTQAIVLGTHSDVIGRQLSDELAVPLWKGAQIARTEINRAYQESLRETWRENKHITPKWIWRSGRTSSTCAVCWAMDGTEHDVEEPMGSHPSCRCSMVPATVSWDDLAAQFGIEMPEGDFDPPKEQTGPEAFAQLPPTRQRAVLGPGKFRAYANGLINLEDLVERRQSSDWGVSRNEGSLDRALARAESRESNSLNWGRGVVGRVRQRLRPDPFIGPTLPIQVPASFSSTDEARDWAKKHLRSSFDGTTFRHTTPELSREVIATIAEFEEMTGRPLPARIDFDPGIQQNTLAQVYFRMRPMRLQVRPDLDQGDIADILMQNARDQIHYGTPYMVPEDVRAIIWHEIGHVLDSEAKGEGSLAAALQLPTRDDRKKISNYAAIEDAEAWAESFVAVVTNSPQAAHVPKPIQDVVRKLLRRNP